MALILSSQKIRTLIYEDSSKLFQSPPFALPEMSIKTKDNPTRLPRVANSGSCSRVVVSERIVVESLKISGDVLMSQINDLIEQGNIHRIVIKNKEGHTLLRVPTHLSAVDNTINAILSAEETAINVISAILPNAKVVIEKIA